MPGLVPHDVVMQKAASLRAADRFGREAAANLAILEMAKEAGVLLAGRQLDELTELEKQAFLGKVIKAVRGGARRAAQRIGVVKRPTTPRGPKRIKVTPKTKQSPAVSSNPQTAVPKPAPRQTGQVGPNQRIRVEQAPRGVHATPMGQGATGGGAPGAPYRQQASTGTAKAQAKPQRYESPDEYGDKLFGGGGSRPAAGGQPSVEYITPRQRVGTLGQAPQATPTPPGRVAPPPQKAPAPKQQAPKQQAKQPAQQAAQVDPQTQQMVDRVTKRRGVMPAMWRNRGALALGGVGLGAYGLYRGAQWGARQLENTSNTPMAYSMGWSPTPYGYGHTPYGPGTPTMGSGG